MTLLIVAAMVMLAVRIAVFLSICMVQNQEKRLLSGAEHPKPRVSRRMMTVPLPAQNYVTKDNVPVRVDAVVCFRVVGAADTARDDLAAMSQLAQTSLRSVIGRTERDDLLSNRAGFGEESTDGSVAHGPQDAPWWGPQDAAGSAQDARRGPQDAVRIDLPVAHLEEPVALDPPRRAKFMLPELKADLGVALTVVKRRGAPKAGRDVAAGRQVENTILDLVPRPAGGPSYLGGRDDAAYLRGWDDAVDWIGQGHGEDAPAWGGVAYMTGWKDAVKALAAARRGEQTKAVGCRIGRAV
jgi:hypothetical protein